MPHRLAITPGNSYNPQWLKFYHSDEGHIYDEFKLWKTLKTEHKAANVRGTPYIEFETEEDAMMFILKWS